MITRFRVEGRHADKEFLMGQLQDAAMKIMKLATDARGISEANEPDGSWECTDERIEGKPGNYRGRMVFVFAEGEYV